jgi:predicted DsbA family dithiol-disulfide isomerase
VERLSAEDAAEPDAGAVSGSPAPVRIDFYTDPLCCWSWVMEPVWRSIRRRRGPALRWRSVLGGMIESWSHFSDPLNDVHRPPQMAPLWHFAGRTGGVPIDPGIWHVDPPASSYPASVAVKAVAFQGRDMGEAYLARAREAAMTRRLNIARREVLLQIAAELQIEHPRAFDAARFAVDLETDAALDAFRSDLQEARMHRIGRFPSIVVHGPAGSRIAVGYRPAHAIERMIDATLPGDAATTWDGVATAS